MSEFIAAFVGAVLGTVVVGLRPTSVIVRARVRKPLDSEPAAPAEPSADEDATTQAYVDLQDRGVEDHSFDRGDVQPPSTLSEDEKKYGPRRGGRW